MLKSPLCQMLSIEHPIIQGGMAWVADAGLAAAVSNAGGLGLIAGMHLTKEEMRAEIRKARKLTNKPFGINVMMMSPHAADIAEVAIEERIAAVTTGAGSPAKFIPAWKEAGIRVLPVIASVAMARKMERAGADAVIAEGCEAGGHIGELTTMALVSQVASAVQIPVVAAGGIADGRGLAAALMLGAVGAQIGTAFLVASECNIHQNYKDRVIKATDIDTIATGKRFGHPVRALKSPFTRAYAAKEAEPNANPQELEEMGAGSLARAAREGNVETGSFMAGQIAGLITCEQPAASIITQMVEGAEKQLEGAAAWLAK